MARPMSEPRSRDDMEPSRRYILRPDMPIVVELPCHTPMSTPPENIRTRAFRPQADGNWLSYVVLPHSSK
jgi:hypothetical protein